VHCFKRGIDEKGFVSRLDEIFDMADELNISISDVLVKISQRTTQLTASLNEPIQQRQNNVKNFTIVPPSPVCFLAII